MVSDLPPIWWTMSCRRFRCANGCCPFQSGSARSCTTTPRSPAPCCASFQFHEATHLTASDWGKLQHTVRHRVLRYFHSHGLLERHVTDDMLTWQAAGGFSIDASVRIPPWDRAGLERLALLIHPPRIHRRRYHGVLAPEVPTEGGSQAQVSGHRAGA